VNTIDLVSQSQCALQGNILITGGAGFIGSALCWHLNRQGLYNIYLVDRLGLSEKWKNLRALRFADYWEVDEFRPLLQSQKLPKFSAIIHLGACSSTTETNASYLIDNNYRFSQEVAQLASHHSSRFLYASSAATYGDGAEGYREDVDLGKLRPLNAYGYSKQIFDQWMQQQGFLNWAVALKFFNVFGPNEEHKDHMRSVVSKSFLQLKELGKVQLFKSHRDDFRDGEQLRDFLYIKDAVDMVVFLATQPTAGIYNLGSGKAQSWLSLVKPIFSSLELDPSIEFIDMPEVLRDKYQYHTEADLTGLQHLGHQGCRWNLQAAVKDYVTNYLSKERHLGDVDCEPSSLNN
jgi:ADP-L-glycero-D-manno-heptose 6-epimerase